MTENENITTLHAVVSGRVQGVGYRMFALGRAQKLGLTGTVRNRADGRVEVQARGDRATLEQFVALLHKGPAFSKVTDVVTQWGASVEPRDSFEIVR